MNNFENMENPWVEFPLSPPFVLGIDKGEIGQYNNRRIEENKINLEHPPDPYLGNSEAMVVLLNANPGHSKEEVDFFNKNSDILREANRKNLLHEAQEYPFYVLDPKFVEWKTHKWWSRNLKDLIREIGVRNLSKKIFCIEFWGYHSQRPPYGLILESQEYSFNLVKKAIKKKVLIVIIRPQSKNNPSSGAWYKQVPELVGYNLCYQVKNSRSASISRKNLPDGIFEKILEFLI